MVPPNQVVSLTDSGSWNGGGVGGEPSDPHDVIFQRNQRDSPLLRLPAELRNKIYEHVLGGHRIRPHCEMVGAYGDSAYYRWSYPRSHLALLRACRQTFSETRLLPFSLNRFGGCPEHILDTMASLTPEQVGTIQAMTLYVDAFGVYRAYKSDSGLTSWFITTLGAVCSYPGLRRVELIWYDPEREGLCERLRQAVLEGLGDFHKKDIKLAVEYWRDDLL